MKYRLKSNGVLYTYATGAWVKVSDCRCVVGDANVTDRMGGVYEAPVIAQALSDTAAHTGYKLIVDGISYLVMDVQYAPASKLYKLVLGAYSNV